MDLADSPWNAAVATLAVWRAARLLSVDAGPAGVLDRLRARAGGALDCLHCTSLWCAAPAALWLGTDAPERVLWWLALSGAAIGLDALFEQPPAPPVRFVEDAPADPRPAPADDAWADTRPDAFALDPDERDFSAEPARRAA